jgi:hypothetical protein
MSLSLVLENLHFSTALLKIVFIFNVKTIFTKHQVETKWLKILVVIGRNYRRSNPKKLTELFDFQELGTRTI